MKFNRKSPLAKVLEGLFSTYAKHVPDVNWITNAMIDAGYIGKQEDILNDHIAFRTMGVQHLGIQSLEKIFLHFGYKQEDYYRFEKKNLNAYWYSPPSEEYPRVFISELCVDELSEQAQTIIHEYTNSVNYDPVNKLNLENTDDVVSFFSTPLWEIPTWSDYQFLLNESEYGAWVLYNRYYLNHYTISVHALPEPFNQLEHFNTFLKAIGVKLNNAGGEIKTSTDGLLRQSSSVAHMIESVFADGDTHSIAGSYVEFAERSVLPQFSLLRNNEITSAHRRDGFEVDNANKIFESTFQKQTTRND